MNRIYAVDFDGTLSIGVPFPEIGEANEPLFEFLINECEKGAKLILWTSRTGKDLKEAVAFCNSRGLHFDAINENLPETIKFFGGDSRKIWANYYIDDKNLVVPGAPINIWQPDEEEGGSEDGDSGVCGET